jgi:hypothetical protein
MLYAVIDQQSTSHWSQSVQIIKVPSTLLPQNHVSQVIKHQRLTHSFASALPGVIIVAPTVPRTAKTVTAKNFLKFRFIFLPPNGVWLTDAERACRFVHCSFACGNEKPFISLAT